MAKKAKKQKKRIVLRIVLIILILIIGILGGIAATLVSSALKTVPSLEDIKFNPKLATSVYDRNGQLIKRLFTENRIWVSLSEIPVDLQHAIVAVEDHEFYKHHGVNPKAILRSFILNIKVRNLRAYGGSTITQQLAKNAFLTQEKRLTRKVKEAVWAIQIDRAYTKEEILETYLNEIWFGHGAYGVEAASQLYFGKQAKDLELEEAALIAGVTNNPSIYSPRVNMDSAKKRRDFVLKRMWEEGYIEEAEYLTAKEKPIVLKEKVTNSQTVASYFTDHVLQYLLSKYDVDTVYGGGLHVYTTLDLDMQRVAEETLYKNLPNGEVDKNGLQQPQGALITIDPKTGEILAMVGGRGQDKLNRAMQAYRQPGSAFKPFIYATALSQGYTPSSIFIDEPVEYRLPSGELWSVNNYHRDFKGPMTLRRALELSINVVAVKLLDKVGIENVYNTITNLGIKSLVKTGGKNDFGLSPLALGALTRGVSLVQMVSAYSVFANQGIYTEPYFVTQITDSRGKIIEENHPKAKVVMDEKVAYLLTDMLQGVVTDGTAKQANIGRPQAGKTGTTDNYFDAWYVGYTPELVTAIWVGEDFPKEMIYGGVKYGSWDCARIWGQYMKKVVEGTEPTDFIRPDGLVDLDVCTDSGLLAQSYCPVESVRREIFIKGTEPKTICTIHEPQKPIRDRNMIPLTSEWEEEKSNDTGSNFIGSLFDMIGTKNETKQETTIPKTQEGHSQVIPEPEEKVPEEKIKDKKEQEMPVSEEMVPKEEPDYIVTVEICTESNKVATFACPQSKVIKVKYLKGAEPTEECDIHGGWQ